MATYPHKLHRFLNSLVLVVGLTLWLAVPAMGHTFWLQDKEDGAHLFLGDAADDERYQEEDVQEAGGLGSDGQTVPVEKVYDHGHMHLLGPLAELLWVKADYGFWRKTTRGWGLGSKKSPGRTLASAWHVQYAKLIKKFSGPRTTGLELEIVFDTVGPDKLTGRALYQGKPASGLALFLAHRKVARTDNQGRFKLSRPEGPVVLSVVYKEKLKNHPDVDHRIVTSTSTLVPGAEVEP